MTLASYRSELVTSFPETEPARDTPMGAHGGAAEIGRIDLLSEAPLTLGALSIDPALRRLLHRDGREEIVEPRIMRVLVAILHDGLN